MKNKKTGLMAVSLIMMMVLSMFFAFGGNAFAENSRLVDNAGLLTQDEFDYVKAYIDEISERQQFDVVILTTDGYEEGSITEFADDFYDNNGYGMGENNDGVIFAIDMQNRELVLTTCGYGIEAITDFGENTIYDRMTDNISSGNYVDAFTKDFADTVDEFVNMAKTGNPYDVEDEDSGFVGTIWFKALVSIGIGLVLGFASSTKYKSELKTVRRKSRANDYSRAGSMSLTEQQDRYLYTNVAVKPKPKDNGGSKSGGTSTHRSSSGRTHGGGHSRSF